MVDLDTTRHPAPPADDLRRQTATPHGTTHVRAAIVYRVELVLTPAHNGNLTSLDRHDPNGPQRERGELA